MKLVFLRGAVPPPNEHPEKLLYDSIEECEDMWTQLFYYLLEQLDAEGELLYETGGPERTFELGRFTEKWVESIGDYSPDFEPDIIICRGGFEYYDKFVMRYPAPKKVYYGAGERYYPQSSFKNYDLFLVDAPRQMKAAQAKTSARVSLFVKPAATMFKPVDVEKRFDVCFMANAAQGEFKGHKEFLKAMAGAGLRILNLGNTRRSYTDLADELGVDVEWGGWSLRKHLPSRISECKIGVCCSLRKDSCPRVIPEYLACGLPIIVTDSVDFWSDKYVTPQTGVMIPFTLLRQTVIDTLSRLDDFSPRAYYDKKIGMKRAVKELAKLMGEI